MHCIRKCHEQKNKSLKVAKSQMHANTQCHSKGQVETAISLIARYALQLLPLTIPGFSLMLLRSDLPQDLQRKKVCQRELTSVNECRGREKLKIESSWCPICSNRRRKKTQAQKQTMENSSTLYLSQSFQASVSVFFYPFAAPFICSSYCYTEA